MKQAGIFAGANPRHWTGKGLAIAILSAMLESYVITLPAAEASPCESSPPVKRMMQRATDEVAAYAERRLAFQEALRLCSDNPASFAAYSVLLLKHGEPAAALYWINQGLKIAPDNPGLRLSLVV